MECTYSTYDKEKILGIFKLNNDNNNRREILSQSLYYYCSGIDPTPVFAFGAKFPLYIYVDNLIYCDAFHIATQKLYERLCCRYETTEKIKVTELAIFGINNIEVTEWRDAEKQSFYIVYVQNDAADTYDKLYQVGSNYIMPKCICNYRNEHGYESILSTVEKRVQYILGHCYSSKYEMIDSFEYFGDYSGDKVDLWKRMYYLLF